MKNNRKNSALFLTRGALIAAMYVALTYLTSLFGLDKGAVQFRLSEALCILPAFMPEAVLGLYIGCLLANVLTGCVVWDIIFGSLATLVGAIGARLLRKLPAKLAWIIPIPTVLANATIIPFVLIYAYGVPDAYIFILATLTLGEIVCALGLGTALYHVLRRNKFFK